MRIVSGELKGKKLLIPKDKNTRPLRDMVKESIFNVLLHSNKFDFNLENKEILDLFSGVGSFGLEALSRNVKKVTFVENYSNVFNILKKNIFNLNCEENSEIYNANCFDIVEKFSNEEKTFDLVFLDPPFKEKKINGLIETIKKKLIKKNGLIILHRHKKDDVKLTENLKIIELKYYGISKIIFGK
jgi:16S rRNA (guanine966-N2)-methyltransferase